MSSRRHLLKLLFLLLILSFSSSCDNNEHPLQIEQSKYSYFKPGQVNDGWKTATFADVSMDASPIVNLMNELQESDNHYIHGLLIVKDGKLVFEEYFDGADMNIFGSLNPIYKEFDPNTLHFQASVTKSITSILVGIAIDKGFISNVNKSAFSFYPEHADLVNDEKNKVTVHNMLAMCSGLEWDESSFPYDDPRSDTYKILNNDDPIRFMLSKPLESTPGTVFHYNSGTTNILGDIVRKMSGMLVTEFARQYLFEPLGITDFEWLRCDGNSQVTFASGGLYLRPRAMAKIGQMYLQEGTWNGNRVVSSNWVKESVMESIPLPTSMRDKYHAYGYGYQWWLGKYSPGDIEAFSARGWGNQYIVVLPSLDMVVVFAGGAFNENIFELPFIYYNIIQDYIIPSVI